MSLNIKDPETHELVRKLAALTGESLTEAVRESVRERLHRMSEEPQGMLSARLLAIGKDCALRLKEPWRSIDHAELLYDEIGLPK